MTKTRNYTTKTAALRATHVDTYDVSATTMDTKKISAKNADFKNLTLEDKDGASKDIFDIFKGGIDVGTKENSFDNKNDTTGFASGISKINFKGAFVNVVSKDDGTIDLWINPDNNYPQISTGSTDFNKSTSKKYVFGSSTDAWQLPTTAGAEYANCHPLTSTFTLKLQGKKDDITSDIISVPNLMSKIYVALKDKGGNIISECITDTITRADATTLGDTGTSLSKTDGGITISLTNIKKYLEKDESGNGWDAEHGFIPNSVSFSGTVSVNLKNADTTTPLNPKVWTMVVELRTYNSDDVLVNTKPIFTSETYYAYDSTNKAVIGDGLSASVTTPKYHWASGVKYITKDSIITVTTAPITKSTVGVSSYSVNRGSVVVDNSYQSGTTSSTAYITGSASDTEATTVGSTTKSFVYGKVVQNSSIKDGSVNAIKTDIVVTQKGFSASSDVSDTTNVTNTENLNYWANPRLDTDKVSYFESENERVLGYMDENYKLIISEDDWDSTQPLRGNATQEYNKQAKVVGTSLIHGGINSEGARYYVRKYVYDANDNSQCDSFYVTVPGITTLNALESDVEVWMFLGSNHDEGRRINLSTAMVAHNGEEGVGKEISGNKIKVVNSLIYTKSDEVYIVLKLNNTNAKVDGILELN